MPQIIAALILVGVAMFAFQVALAFLLIAGLIFRTKETIGVVLALSAMALFRNYPLACIVIGVVVGAVTLHLIHRRAKEDAPPDQTPALTDETTS